MVPRDAVALNLFQFAARPSHSMLERKNTSDVVPQLMNEWHTTTAWWRTEERPSVPSRIRRSSNWSVWLRAHRKSRYSSSVRKPDRTSFTSRSRRQNSSSSAPSKRAVLAAAVTAASSPLDSPLPPLPLSPLSPPSAAVLDSSGAAAAASPTSSGVSGKQASTRSKNCWLSDSAKSNAACSATSAWSAVPLSSRFSASATPRALSRNSRHWHTDRKSGLGSSPYSSTSVRSTSFR
mmetsp:Transcript_29696/g.97110  ORF Transcript_29696/g.97110 Transcript_29696/m.97110 type:complete len:235 (+) Transcript_29696:1483-2187(+)